MNQEQRWLTLQKVALDDVQADWLPGFDPVLVNAARHTRAGRAWLARRLAIHCTLFGYLSMPEAPGWDGSATSPALSIPALPEWLFAQAHSWQAPVMAVGAQVCLPSIRASVQREHVVLLRQALGDSLYEHSIQLADAELAVTGYMQPAPVWPGGVEAVRQQIFRLGIIEIYHALLGLHPVAAERCALAFPRTWALADMPPVLNREIVQRCWEVCQSSEPLQRSHNQDVERI